MTKLEIVRSVLHDLSGLQVSRLSHPQHVGRRFDTKALAQPRQRLESRASRSACTLEMHCESGLHLLERGRQV